MQNRRFIDKANNVLSTVLLVTVGVFLAYILAGGFIFG